MNAREKLNVWTLAAVIGVAWVIAETTGSALLFGIIALVGIAWAVQTGHIR